MKKISKNAERIYADLCKIGERLLNILILSRKRLKKQKLYGKIRILAFYFVYSMKKQGINTYRYGSFLPN
jgi:hypothetical protein